MSFRAPREILNQIEFSFFSTIWIVLLTSFFISILSLIYPTQAQADSTSTHHETIFKYDKSHLQASYNLNLSYADFKTVYPKLDQDQDGFISESEGKIWLETWKNSFSIETNDQKLIPQSVRNFPSRAELDPILLPTLSFEIDFGIIDLSDIWQEFKITNTYRVGSDPNEYWAASDDQKSLKFDLETIDISNAYSISGRWKSLSALDNKATDAQKDLTNTPKSLVFDLKNIFLYFKISSGVIIIILGFYLLHKRILDFIDYKINQAKAENISKLKKDELINSDPHSHHTSQHKINYIPLIGAIITIILGVLILL